MSETHPDVAFTWAGFWQGARDCVPVIAALVPFGLVCGMIGHSQGLSFSEISLMSAVVYAGASQLVALAIWTHPPDLIAVTVAALVVNLRFALMGPVLSPWLDRLRGWRLWLSLFLMIDHNWALSVRQMKLGHKDAAYLLGGGALLFIPWVASTSLGFVLGAELELPPGHPLFFAALAAFICILTPMWTGLADLLPWTVAAVVALLVSHLMPGTFWYIIAGAIAGSVAGGVRDHRKRLRP